MREVEKNKKINQKNLHPFTKTGPLACLLRLGGSGRGRPRRAPVSVVVAGAGAPHICKDFLKIPTASCNLESNVL